MLRRLLGLSHIHRSVPLRSVRRYVKANWRDSQTRVYPSRA